MINFKEYLNLILVIDSFLTWYGPLLGFEGVGVNILGTGLSEQFLAVCFYLIRFRDPMLNYIQVYNPDNVSHQALGCLATCWNIVAVAPPNPNLLQLSNGHERVPNTMPKGVLTFSIGTAFQYLQPDMKCLSWV